MTDHDTIICATGNNPSSGWCQPCRSVGQCLGFKRVDRPDMSVPQPFRGGALTPDQEWVIDELKKFYAELEAAGKITTSHGLGEDAAAMGVRPSTCVALWKRGWIVRSVLDRSPLFDKWWLTDAAWDHLHK